MSTHKLKKLYISKFQIRNNQNKKPTGFVILPQAVWNKLNLKQSSPLKLTPIDDGILIQRK